METKDQVKEQIKQHLVDYAKETGRPTGKGHFLCFDPRHQDTKPSMKFMKEENYYKCFGAGHEGKKTYDIFDLYALDNNLDVIADFPQIKEALANKYKIDLKRTYTPAEEPRSEKKKEEKLDFSNYYKKCNKEVDKTNYFTSRGITEELIEKYNLGYDSKTNYAIIPVSKSFYVMRDTLEQTEEERKISKRLRYDAPKGTTTELFNLKNLQEATFKSVIFITESVIDALSLEVVEPKIETIALNGASNINRLVDAVKESNFTGYFVLCLDNDTNKAGQKASSTLRQELEKRGYKVIVINEESKNKEDIYNGCKDINEYLLQDAEGLKTLITLKKDNLEAILQKEAQEILEKENTYNYLQGFNEITLNVELNAPLKTGIGRLDKALYGGFFKKNLVILGASSGIGKTTIALQIADNIAESGQDALIFSLEMSREELIAKSLSRLMFLEDKKANGIYSNASKCLTTRGILTGKMYKADAETQELYTKAYNYYRDNLAKHIYITEQNETKEITIAEIEEQIKRHIAITNARPFVVIDYLQIIENKERGLTDIQAIGKIVKDLKRIARKYELTILVISAFNRGANYQEADYTSFRDTSTIEYTADVLLSFHYAILDNEEEKTTRSNIEVEAKKSKKLVNDAMEDPIKKLTLTILKNRNGLKTKVKYIDFYGANNYMDFRTYDYSNNKID